MKCSKCGFNNPKDMKFCGQCGAPLAAPKDRYTDIAKSTLPEGMKNKILAAKIDGERKNVTVLFADVSGFTALSEKLDPEEVRELINSLFRILVKIIYKYEGTIDKFIGDCIMALFGAPITHEDDPERAVHAALEIMGALEQFNQERVTELTVHIGINSGVVVTGGVGSDLRMEYTVIGDTVNLASRLMDLAKDDIYVSETVYKITEYLFNAEELKPVAVKGKAEKIIPYRVIGIKEKPGRKRGVPELYSPIVGRKEELETMRSVLSGVMEGRAEVISLIGEAGIGKSRLVEEIRNSIDGQLEWIGGKCFSYGKTFPFLVFLEQIRSYLGISELDPEPESRKKLEKKARFFFKDKIDEYLAYLCLFLSLEVPEHLEKKVKHLNPQSLKLQMFVSVKALYREITKQKPLVLYFEDMHWVDPESLELILFLLDSLKKEPILFIFETRPEKETGLYMIMKPIQSIFKKHYSEIYLRALSTKGVNTLVQNLLKISDFPKNVSSLILEKSEGNPFYIEEIICSFIDSGVLEKKDGEWHFVSDVSSFEVPDTVEAVVRSRIDRLSHEPKEVLGNASVIGRSFPYPILFCTCSIREIDKAIETLDRGEFIIKVNTPEPMFKHILIRDVAYNGLLKKQRMELHKKTAECIERIFKKRIEDYYEVLAYHYNNAEIYDKSYDYYRKAADEAKDLYRNDVAIACYTRAIETCVRTAGKDEEIADLYEKRGDVRLLKAEYDDAFKDYENAFNHNKDLDKKAGIKRKIGGIFRQKGECDNAISYYEEVIGMMKDQPESSVLLETLISYAWLLSEGKNDYQQAEKMAKQALKKIDERKEPSIYAQGLAILGGIFYHQGNYNNALKHSQKSLAIYEKLNDKRRIGVGYGTIGVIYWVKGEFDTALKCYKESLAIYEEIGDRRGIGVASNNIGMAYENRGDLSTALEYYARFLAISDETGNKKGIAVAYGNIGLIYLHKGDIKTALKYCKTYLNISEEIGNKMGVGIAHQNIAEVYKEAKKYDDAKKHLDKSEKILTDIGDKGYLSMTFNCLSEIETAQDNRESAIRFAEKALSLATESGLKVKEISALRIMGEALSREDLNKAVSCLKQSISLAEKEKLNYELAISLYKLAVIFKNIGKNKDAEKKLKEAEKIFEKSGAELWLKKSKTLWEEFGKY